MLLGSKAEHGITPGLAWSSLGTTPASQIVRLVKGAGETVEVGIFGEVRLPADRLGARSWTSFGAWSTTRPKIRLHPRVQLPVPEHIDPNKIIATISPDKDVDCFTPRGR